MTAGTTATGRGDHVPAVAFIGVGAMGRHMATNLVRAGQSLRVYDLRSDAIELVVRMGAVAAQSVADAVRDASAVFLSLPDSGHVERVLLEPGGVADSGQPGTLVIDLSTIAAPVSRRLGAALERRGLEFLDAPVSGGVVGAEAGTLSIMVGGSDAAFARAEPLLYQIGRTVTHVGNVGMGQLFKSCNQIVCALNIQALCEAFALARSQGADLSLLRTVLQGGAAGSWMLDNLGPQMIDGDSGAGFRIQLQVKDLRLAAEAAHEAGVPLPGTAQVIQLYLEALAHGEGDNGNQALFRVYERLTGQT